MSFHTTKGPIKRVKRHKENKSKIGQERSSMQTTSDSGPLHECKKVRPCTKVKSTTKVRHSRMNQAMSEEEEKERKRNRKDRGLMERKAAQQNKNTSEEIKQALPRHR